MLAQAALALLSSAGADTPAAESPEMTSMLAASVYGSALIDAFDPTPAGAFDPKVFLGNDEDSFSYTYAEIGYSVTDLDQLDDDSKTLAARGSLALLHFFHVFVDYQRESVDFDDAEAETYGLGVGAQFGLIPRVSLLAEVSWLYNNIDSDTVFDSDSDSGWMGFVGARVMVLDWTGGGLEANGGVRFIDLDSLLSDQEVLAYEVGARVHLLKLLSVGATYTFLEDDRRYGVNVRVSF